MAAAPASPMPRLDHRAVFDRLLAAYGPQHWWPASDGPFEVMVGAVLTQNTAWTNVERAIANLRDAGLLEPAAMGAAPTETLAEAIRPSGYFNVKARRLQALVAWYHAVGGAEALARWSTDDLRRGLLEVNGVGPETADDIVLYAFHRPVFVIDAYTRRIFQRLGLEPARGDGYEDWRAAFEAALFDPADPAGGVALFNEYHALIVAHGKDVCRPRPLCGTCVLADACPGREQ